MQRRLAIALTAGLTAATLGVAGGSASAAHCTDDGGPGHSDFAAHVRANNGPGGHNEGQHRGWSSCEENSNNYVTP